jgi:hypothetical protein
MPETDSELQRRLEETVAQYQRDRGAGGASGRPDWLRPPAPAGGMPQNLGFSVPIEIEVNGPMGFGKVTIYLSFPPEAFSHAKQVIEDMLGQGYPIRVFTPKRDRGDFGGGQGYNGGGWNNRGGYRGGYGGWNR